MTTIDAHTVDADRDVPLDPRGQGPDAPWHVTGSRRPVHDEVTITELEVRGSIPPELSGRYVRNTANPRTGYTEHWFLGDGMLHGMEIANGRANWYRNRYVRTPMFEHPGADRTALSLDMETLTMNHNVSAANTHVIGHGGKVLALEEGAYPYEVTPQLDTVGPWTFDGRLTGPFTAHPKFCPDTGEMLAFGYAQFPPYLTYYRVDANGELVQSTEITVNGPTMMHDFAASRHHVVFMDLPMIFDLDLAMQGGMPIRWSDDYPARFGVMPREGSDADVQWFDIDPCYVFHTMNAYDDGDEVVMYGCRIEELWRDSAEMTVADADPGAGPVLTEWRLDRSTGRATETRLDDVGSEFPRIPNPLAGHRSRYGYTIGMGGAQGSEALAGSLHKYDFGSTGTGTASKDVHHFPAGHEPGEAVFVPADGAGNEDDGYMMTYVYQPETDTSYLAILDASNFAADPIAEIHVPRRIVAGFHTSWIPDEPA
jgi:carotenoid cleavage dioxygenase